jgi:hypothetical protein
VPLELMVPAIVERPVPPRDSSTRRPPAPLSACRTDAGGMRDDEIPADFPSLMREHIPAVPAYAAPRERRDVIVTGATA